MTMNNLLYIFLLSALATFVMWIFNVEIFHECYMSSRFYVATSLLPPMPQYECLLVVAAIAFVILTIPPILVGYFLHFIFSITGVNTKNAAYGLWIFWAGMVFYVAFLLSLLSFSSSLGT